MWTAWYWAQPVERIKAYNKQFQFISYGRKYTIGIHDLGFKHINNTLVVYIHNKTKSADH